MDDLQVFGFEGRNVRVVEVKGEPWWVGRDVCDILGYENASKAMGDHCKGITNRYPLSTDGGTQDVRIISEPDVLRLIMKSTMPEAERFERWVFEEVLPSIRKTGSYGVPKIQKAPSPMLVSSVNRAFTLGLIQKEIATAMILADCVEKHKAPKTGASVQTQALPASTIRPLFAFFDHAEFAGWRTELESNPRHFERLGVALRTRRGNPELLIQHDHKLLTKVCGKDYKTALRDDPAYIGTVQAHIARNQVSCLVFDWRRV